MALHDRVEPDPQRAPEEEGTGEPPDALPQRRRRPRRLARGGPARAGRGSRGDPRPGRALPPSPPEETLGREELYRLALREIEALEPDAREVVVLRDMQDLSYEEMAVALDCPVGTVRSRLHRARVTLRARLTPLISSKRDGGAA
ncbi:MAG: sigma-70 family RNA polymerase sigma factor [Planctomycetota bacterium]